MRTLFWLILVALIVMAPSFILGPALSHSGNYNFIWTSQFADAMRGGTLYPRWLPSSFEGMGSPTFYFYPPLAYMLSGGLNALGLTTLQAINGAAFLFLLLSGMTMHKWLLGRTAYPLFGAICYMIAPYHLLDFGVRGALAEFASFVWLPLIALGIERLPERRGILLLAISFAGIVLTHLPMATLAGIFLIAPLVLWRAWTDRALLVPAIIAGILALSLSAFYLLPAMTMQGYISSQALWSPYFNPVNWHFFWHPDRSLGNVQLLGLGMIVLALSARSVWTSITAASAIAAIGIIPFLWLIPPLDKVQFPWRLLGVTEFAAITALFTSKLKIHRGLIVVGLAMLAVPYVLLVKYATISFQRQPDYTLLAQTMPDAVEYLPNGYDYWPIINAKRALNLSAYKALPREDVIAVQKPGIVTMGRWTFPIWQVQRNGQVVPSKGPLIQFRAEKPGTYRIVRVWIWQEIVGAITSMIALLAALFLWRRRAT